MKVVIALTEAEGVIVPNQLMTELLATQLKILLESIQRIEKEINKRYKAMADRKIFDSFPGAGAQYAPRLLVAFGSNRDRYQSASAVQKYAGIAPVIKWMRIMFRCWKDRKPF